MLSFLPLLLFVAVNSIEVTAIDPTSCFLCEQVIGFTLTNPQFANNTEWLLNKLCALLPEREKKTCSNLVHYVEALFDFIQKGFADLDDDPFAICCMINYCSHQCCLSHLPEQIHLSYIGDPHTEIGVVWTTLENVSSVVQYGLDPNHLDQSQTGSVSTYSGGGWVGFMHKVRIHNLKPGSVYSYRVGDGGSVWSEKFTFRTEANENRMFRVATIGDMGIENSQGNMRHLQKLTATNAIDFVLHAGDISYADGDQIKWDIYMRLVQNITAYVPYMVTPGNHEIGITGLLGLSLGYINRFILPGEHSISDDLENMYYSFNYGNIHFIALDTEARADVALLTKQQILWLTADLAAVDRKVTPWVVVCGHRPFYCSNPGVDCGIMATVLKDAAEEILNHYKVDLVLTAHKHNYERFWPSKPGGIPVKTYTNPNAPIYIVNGAGGNREGKGRAGNLLNNSVTFLPTFGYGIITSHNSSVLEWNFYDSEDGVSLDGFVLKVDH